ncbi:MAG: MarR family transcriptional regulator [Roseiflexaceae bacterium]
MIVTPFANQYEKAIVNLAYTYGVFLDRMLSILKDYDLNDQHYNILKTLNEHDPRPISVGEIKQLLINKRGDLTRLLDKLSALGLVNRELDPENRRVVLVSLTPTGKQQLHTIDTILNEQRRQQRSLTDAEAAQLNDLLDRLRG